MLGPFCNMIRMLFLVYVPNELDVNMERKIFWKPLEAERISALSMGYVPNQKTELRHTGYTVLHSMTNLLLSTEAMQRIG